MTVFPMRKEKKASREEAEVVCITEWRDPSSNGEKGDRYWLFIKRPEKGETLHILRAVVTLGGGLAATR